MSKTQSGAATQATNSANDAISYTAKDQYENKLFPRLTGVGDVAGSRAGQDYSAASAGYGDFAKTGGFSDADKTSYLNRATSGVHNTFDVLKNQAALAGRRTGGGSAPAAIAQIARQGGQAQAEALDNAQVGLHSQINANKLAGIGGQAGLFNTNVGQQDVANQQYLSGLGGENQAVASYINAKANAAKYYNKSITDEITPWANLGSGVLTGLGY